MAAHPEHTITAPRRWTAGLAALVGALALAATLAVAPAGATRVAGPAAHQRVAGSTTGGGYVALGDSYASAPVIPTQLSPTGCDRSSSNYPHLVAAALGLSLTDVTCGGATTADMTGAQQLAGGGTNPAQLEAVNASTSLVTLTVGGDDLGFSSILENCLAYTPLGPTSVGWTCRSHYDAGGVDSLATAISVTGPKLVGVLAQIHALAPRARVLVVGYPAILPPTGAGCWPRMPFTLTDAAYLRSVEVDLNAMLASVAARNGATYVDTYDPSTTHNACAPESTRWVEPVLPEGAAPVHPNAAGEAAMASMVEASLRPASA